MPFQIHENPWSPSRFCSPRVSPAGVRRSWLRRQFHRSRPHIKRVSRVLIGSRPLFHVFFRTVPDRAPSVLAQRPHLSLDVFPTLHLDVCLWSAPHPAAAFPLFLSPTCTCHCSPARLALPQPSRLSTDQRVYAPSCMKFLLPAAGGGSFSSFPWVQTLRDAARGHWRLKSNVRPEVSTFGSILRATN